MTGSPLSPLVDFVHPEEMTGREVLLLGLGAFGGGAGCARVLIEQGARLTITDLRPAEQLQEGLQSLEGLPFELALGGHRAELFARADFVVVNPAVPVDSKWLRVARQAGCKITTEVNLALAQAAQVPALAITGTHGKSTTAALAAHLGAALPGRTQLGGNLGGSLLAHVQGLGPGDRLVVELSSFQLERLVAPAGWPQVALLTCMGEDHLDRHGDFATYEAAKRRLLKFQKADGVLLLPAATDGAVDLRPWAEEAHGGVEWIAAPTDLDACTRAWGLSSAEVPVREPYRLQAVAMALRGMQLLGGTPLQREGTPSYSAPPLPTFAGQLRTFPGLPHRLQEIAAPAGCRILDNGVATHPQATAAALRHLSGPVLLLAGGKDKGLPLDDLVEACTPSVRLFLSGPGGHRLAALLLKKTLSERPNYSLFADFSSAAAAALKALQAPSILLFSPSFSSFDEFRNFRDRAQKFLKMCGATQKAAQREQVTSGLRRTKRE